MTRGRAVTNTRSMLRKTVDTRLTGGLVGARVSNVLTAGAFLFGTLLPLVFPTGHCCPTTNFPMCDCAMGV